MAPDSIRARLYDDVEIDTDDCNRIKVLGSLVSSAAKPRSPASLITYAINVFPAHLALHHPYVGR